MTQGTPVVVTVKPWWMSKTLWVNAIALGLVALEAQFSLLQPYIPGNVYAWMVVALAVVNKVLRVITTGPLAFQAAPAQADSQAN
jgi:NADH:ubiquinone oxidoreductase subunit K